MKKILVIFIAAMALLMMSACDSTESSSRGAKPRRETSGGSLPWARPADWEGGLPGMGSMNTGQRNY